MVIKEINLTKQYEGPTVAKSLDNKNDHSARDDDYPYLTNSNHDDEPSEIESREDQEKLCERRCTTTDERKEQSCGFAVFCTASELSLTVLVPPCIILTKI